MEKDAIKKLILEKGLTLTDVVDAVVELNGYIGVGLISLGDGMKEYCYKHKGAARTGGKETWGQ